MARGHRRTVARRACPLLHDCLFCIDWAWYGVRARCKRRRNSYKVFLFYGMASCITIVIFALAVVFYHILWGNIRSIDTDCQIDQMPKNDSELRARTLEQAEAVSCSNEISSLGACDLGEMKAVLDAILVNGITSFLQAFLYVILTFSFRVFTNLPAERLQYDKTTRCTIFIGGLCKQGPWLTRFLHFFQACVLFVYWMLLFSNYCKGDLTKTYNCANYQRNCAYNKLRNCQYYYVHCNPDKAELLKCFSNADRIAFSGRMDIRLLTHDNCTRCSILADDLQNSFDEDQFWLLQESARDTDSWSCTSSLRSCFHTTQWNSLACTCQDSIRGIMSLEKLQSLAGTCRRLASPEEGEGPASPPASAPALRSSAARRAEAEDSESTDVSGDPLPEQACKWAPGNPPAYFFSEDHCDQQGSYVFRFSLLYVYLACCSWFLLTLVGQAVRILSHPEPWFFNPRSAHEGLGWRFLRLMGP